MTDIRDEFNNMTQGEPIQVGGIVAESEDQVVDIVVNVFQRRVYERLKQVLIDWHLTVMTPKQLERMTNIVSTQPVLKKNENGDEVEEAVYIYTVCGEPVLTETICRWLLNGQPTFSQHCRAHEAPTDTTWYLDSKYKEFFT